MNLHPPHDEPVTPDAGLSDETANRNEIRPGELRLRRLSPFQYEATVRRLFGDSAAEALVLGSAEHDSLYRSIYDSKSEVTLEEAERYEQNAFAVAQAAYFAAQQDSASLDPWSWCHPISLEDTNCMSQIVYRLGRLVFRRPLSQAEMLRWRAVGMNAAAHFENYNAGIEFVIAGLLQSPFFLHVVEIGYPDPDDPDVRFLSPYELVTRMSFLLTGATPTEEDLDAAERGDLETVTGRKLQAEGMLASVLAPVALRNFFTARFHLDRLEETPKDSLLFPSYNEHVPSSLREESLRLLDDVVWQRNVDFRSAFNAPYTFVDQTLRDFYGLPAELDAGTGFERVDYDGGVRSGLLTQGSYLAVHATAKRTSPTLRGKFIRENLLCQPVDPPPPTVNTTLPELDPDEPHLTMRQRLANHQNSLLCSTCHASMDPLGFAFEHFDGAGRYRATDEGLEMDTTGVLFGQPFDGAKDLGNIIRDREEVAMCLVRHLYRHAVGHLEVAGEQEQLQLLDYLFELRGYRLKEFMLDLVSSPLFETLGTAAGMTEGMNADPAVFDGGAP